MSGIAPSESIRTLLARGDYKELVTRLEPESSVIDSIIAGAAWFHARDRADRALECLEREFEVNELGLVRVAHAMAALLREEPLDEELVQALGPPEEETLDPWLMVSVMDFCDYGGVYDASAEWRSRLLESLDADALPEVEEASCRAHAACSLVRSALELAPEVAIRAAETGMPLFEDSMPAAHPRRVEYFAMSSAAALLNRNAAFMHGFVDAAHREAVAMPEGNERIRRMTEDMWDACGRPESMDLAWGVRAIAVGGEALGFFARRGRDLYSCMARESTTADLLGALARGDRAWHHANIGLRLEDAPGSRVRLVLAATHPEADDFEADLEPEHVAALLAFASVHDLPVRRFVGVGRNEPCPCGSGKKFKRCCGAV